MTWMLELILNTSFGFWVGGGVGKLLTLHRLSVNHEITEYHTLWNAARMM